VQLLSAVVLRGYKLPVPQTLTAWRQFVLGAYDAWSPPVTHATINSSTHFLSNDLYDLAYCLFFIVVFIFISAAVFNCYKLTD